jgi:sulfide:quinone oxidoreductase
MDTRRALGDDHTSMADGDVPAPDPAVEAGPGRERDAASASPLHVVIAGGGVAGLEALTALRALADRRVELTLVTPAHEFVYRPVEVDEPFTVGRSRRIPIARAARELGADYVSGTVESVNPDEKLVHASGHEAVKYDALVLALGAKPVPSVAGAITWNDQSDAEILGGLLRDFEQGYGRRMAVVIPPGPVWPLRGYELALFITLQARGMSVDIETTIVTPEQSPLALLTPRASQRVAAELERARIDVVSATGVHVEPGHPNTVLLDPGGRRLEADRVVALPALCGHPIPGIPARADGFMDVDEHCRVPGLDGVWAVGDSTTFPLKAGGFAAEQADVAAEDIAAAAGAAVEPHTFDPVQRDDLAGLPAGRFFESWLAETDPTLTTHLPSDGLPVLTFLRRDFQASWRGDI